MKSIVIPENVISIGDNAFNGCSSLSSITLSENITEIPGSTFRGCSSLKSIVIPENVTSVGSYAFRDCKNLTQVVFKNDLTQVVANAFEGCTKLLGFPRPSVTVNSLKIKNSGIEGTVTYTDDNLKNYNISVKNSVGKEIFAGISNSYIVIDVNQVSANETITIKLEHKNGKTLSQTVTVTLDSECKASVDEIIMRENGYLKINYPSEHKNIKAVIYDKDGNYIDSYIGRYGTIKSKYLSGEFNVYILNTSLENYSFSSTEEYANRGLVIDQDYFVYTVTVEDNQLASINLTTVPKDTDTKLSCLSVRGVESDVSTLSENGYITYKITYKMKSGNAANADKLTVSLSDNLSFISGSLSINDNPTQISTADRYNKIEVSVKDIREGIITLKAMPVSNGQYTVKASNSFNENGKAFSEQLGNDFCNASFITLNGKRDTNRYSTFVMGVTSSTEPIEIYVNGSSVLTITPDSKGKYSADITLNEQYIESGTEFDIYAKNAAGIESKHLKVQYNFEKPVIEKFYFSQGTNSKQDLTNALYDGSRPLISLIPWRALNYELEISNSDSIRNVYIISDKNSEIKMLEAKYQGNCKWLAYGDFNHSDNAVPGHLYVAYTSKSSSGENQEDGKNRFEELKEYYDAELIDSLCDLTSYTGKLKEIYRALEDLNDARNEYSDYGDIIKAYEAYIESANEAKENGADSSLVDLLVSLYELCSYTEIVNRSILFAATLQTGGGLEFICKGASEDLSSAFSSARAELEEILRALANGENINSRLHEFVQNSNIKNLSKTIDGFFGDLARLQKNQGVSPRFIIDPSGYVYEAIPENRLSGVTVRIYYKENEDNAEQLWNAIEYEQENELVTGVNGEFAWEVSEGWYRVEAVKEGYETASSEWMYIPPERTDVYIPMYDYTAPEVKSVIMKDENVEVLFDKFMQISTVTDSAITLLKNGTSIDFTVEAVWDETGITAENGYTAAKRFRLIPKNGELNDEPYDIIIDSSVTSYANVMMKTLFSKRIEPEDTVSPVSAVIKMGTNKAVVNNNIPVVSSDYIYVNNKAMASADSLQKLFSTEMEESVSCYKITINGVTILAYKNTTEWEIATHNNQTIKVNVKNPVQTIDKKAYFSIRDICTLAELSLNYTVDLSGQYVIITNAAGADEVCYNELLQSAKPYFDDYGNTFDTAYQWEISPVGVKTANGTLDYTSDIDMFKFTVPITGTYTLYSSDSTPNLKAWLYDSTQMQIAGDDDSGDNGNFKITVSLTEGQTYYLKVGQFEENGMGSYTINLSMDVLILKYNSQYSVLNGNKIENTQYNSGYASMILSNGVSMIPVRFLCEVIGMKVVWNEDIQMATIINPGTGEYVSLTINSCTAVKYSQNGEKLYEWKLSTSPQFINGMTMIPLRAISECLGYCVEYTEKDYGIYVIISGIPQTENIDMLCEMAKKLGV